MSEPQPRDSIQKPKVDDILKKCILLYGYNLELRQKINSSFGPLSQEVNEKCCIINSEWIKKFKDIYKYKLIENHIFAKKCFGCKSFNDFEHKISDIIKDIKQSQKIQIDIDPKNELTTFLFFPVEIKSNMESIHYFKDFCVVNQKIRDELYSLYIMDENNIKPNEKTLFCNLSIFLLNNKNGMIAFEKELLIGTIDKNGIFSPIYNIRFGNAVKIEDEINNIKKQKDIDAYLKSRSFKKGTNFLQYLKFQNHGNIGTCFDIKKYEELNKNNLSNNKGNYINNNFNNTNNLNNGNNKNSYYKNNLNNTNNNFNNFNNNVNLKGNKNKYHQESNNLDNIKTYIVMNDDNTKNLKTKYGFSGNNGETEMVLKKAGVFTKINKKKPGDKGDMTHNRMPTQINNNQNIQYRNHQYINLNNPQQQNYINIRQYKHQRNISHQPQIWQNNPNDINANIRNNNMMNNNIMNNTLLLKYIFQSPFSEQQSNLKESQREIITNMFRA